MPSGPRQRLPNAAGFSSRTASGLSAPTQRPRIMSSAQSESIDYLFGLEQFGIKLGLDNIRALCQALGHPDHAFTSIVVAGTNGKGSVAAMVDTALRSAGYVTGRFTSPHLVDLEERFAVDGRPVAHETLAREAHRLRTTVGQLQADGRLGAPPTFFEATTAIALSLFRQAGIRVAVIEVGMGGRFDATNVVVPAAVAITSIDFDHQQYLGSTLAEIAFEKAGVIKPGALVVVGETKPSAVEVLRRVCRENEGRIIEPMSQVETRVTMRDGRTELEMITPCRRYGPVQLGLRGRHQVGNAAVAVRLLEELHASGLPVPGDAILDGLTKTRWRGRLELVRVDQRRSVVLDAAHNVAAATALARYLKEVWPTGVPLVFAALRDKDVSGMVQALGSSVTEVICAPLTSKRALAPDELVARVRQARADLPTSVARSPRAALEMAWRRSDVICAAGSVYLVGQLIETLTPDDRSTGTRAPLPQ